MKKYDGSIIVGTTEMPVDDLYRHWGYVTCSLLSVYEFPTKPVEVFREAMHHLLACREYGSMEALEDSFFAKLTAEALAVCKRAGKRPAIALAYPVAETLQGLKEIVRYYRCNYPLLYKYLADKNADTKERFSAMARFAHMADYFRDTGEANAGEVMKLISRTFHVHHDL